MVKAIEIADLPEHPDGYKYEHNCCPSPNVWVYSDGSERCKTCGYIWKEKNNSFSLTLENDKE